MHFLAESKTQFNFYYPWFISWNCIDVQNVLRNDYIKFWDFSIVKCIQKAIDKAVGSTGGEDFESIRYEGYGPHGIAIMVDCLTDNRNRTASLVRSTFTKRGGNLGTDGSVSYLFERKGVIVIEKNDQEDEIMMTVLDAGADDFIVNEDTFEIYTTPDTFLAVKEALENMGITSYITSEITYVASNLIELDDESKEKVLNLVDALDELDDVQDVYHNLSE